MDEVGQEWNSNEIKSKRIDLRKIQSLWVFMIFWMSSNSSASFTVISVAASAKAAVVRVCLGDVCAWYSISNSLTPSWHFDCLKQRTLLVAWSLAWKLGEKEILVISERNYCWLLIVELMNEWLCCAQTWLLKSTKSNKKQMYSLPSELNKSCWPHNMRLHENVY